MSWRVYETESNILQDRAIQEGRLLLDETDMTPQSFDIHILDVCTV
jgi:hypothetical protein